MRDCQSYVAEDIERLARLAYPEASSSMLELLTKDQFVDAVPDEDMRLRIRQSRPKSVREALKVALELESYQLASRQRQKTVRTVRTELPEMHSGTTAPSDGTPPWLEELSRCIKQLTSFKSEVASTKPQSKPPRRPAVVDLKNVT